ncbi:PREDICTED: glutamate-rich protein 4 [Miniopterus natalensis]|uniref:glutamate-rich protein 4 n=1 Tax=Miniopterus natalensis TaxID=291302 RepID=UPI0007A7151B|nr:PREDICTED: glutamate-rich protein 4 [Miniopterus natalensis]
MDFGMLCMTLPSPFHCPLLPHPPGPQGPGSFWTLLLPAAGSHCSETMELWKQLREAGLVPPGLGPPPRALRDVPPSGRADQTLMSPGADPEGAKETLLLIWEELDSLRRVDVQLLGQLCSLGLEMGELREELVAFLEEEEEEPEGKQEEGHLGVSCPASGHRLPDFEMTI